jgi:mono/diheme cytochrome c family protein
MPQAGRDAALEWNPGQGETELMTTPNPGIRLAEFVALAALALLLAPAPAFAGDAEAGKVMFTLYCVPCHGESGTGDGPAGIALDPRPRNFTANPPEFKFDTDGDGKVGTDVDLKNTIKQGGIPYGGSPLMAPWLTLTDTQIEDLIAYIRLFKK